MFGLSSLISKKMGHKLRKASVRIAENGERIMTTAVKNLLSDLIIEVRSIRNEEGRRDKYIEAAAAIDKTIVAAERRALDLIRAIKLLDPHTNDFGEAEKFVIEIQSPFHRVYS